MCVLQRLQIYKYLGVKINNNTQLMHKKLEADLMSLAHSILKMKDKNDIKALKDKAKNIYEKLSVLDFVDEYVLANPQLKEEKEEIIEKVEQAFEAKEQDPIIEESPEVIEEKIVHNLMDDQEVFEKVDTPKEPEAIIKEKVEEVIEKVVAKEPELKIEKPKSEPIEQPFDELESLMFDLPQEPQNFKNDVKDVGDKKTPTLDEELKDTISVDVMADLFENAQPISLNDRLAKNISIGLNDRIAFVKNLFNNNQEDYNRVVNQLNTFSTEKEAKSFVNDVVKPDYDWSQQEELETRFFEIIERKFA